MSTFPHATPDEAARDAGPGPAAPPQVPADRRRKLLLRLTLGPLLAGGTVALLVWDHVARHQAGITLLLAVAAGAGLAEFYAILRAKGLRPASGMAVFLAVFTLLLRASNGSRVFADLGLSRVDDVLAPLYTFLGPTDLFLVGLLVLLAGLVIGRRRTVDDVAATAFGIAYVWFPLFLFFEILDRFVPPDRAVGEATLFILLASNKVSDSAAFLCGTFFGRHPMAPAISPKKTWEGAAGGMLFGTAAGLLAAKLLLPPGWGTGSEWAGAAVFSAVLAAAGQLGDLVESAFKRWAGVKDSGRLVPEFGGVLDMIDGFLVSAPVAYLFLKAGGEAWIFG